jgi:polyisoprenoid-binding protein YceI
VDPTQGPPKGRAADLRATFTIKGITAPLPLPVTVTELEDGSIRISGETEVDRSQFGLGWNRLGMVGATATAAADTVFVRAPR